MGVSANIQQAVFSALDGNSALTSQLATNAVDSNKKAIYDAVPQAAQSEDKTAFPFVVIGDWTEVDFDTDDSAGRECTVTIHTFSRALGMKELKNVMDAIKAVLHKATLMVSGEIFIDSYWEFAEAFRDPDGKTRHGVQRFRITTSGT